MPVRARFSAPVQTGPEAYPASYTVRVKRPGRGVDHPSPHRAEVKEGVELYLYSPSGNKPANCEATYYEVCPKSNTSDLK